MPPTNASSSAPTGFKQPERCADCQEKEKRPPVFTELRYNALTGKSQAEYKCPRCGLLHVANEDAGDGDGYDRMTKAELLDVVAEKELTTVSTTNTKAEIVAALRGAK